MPVERQFRVAATFFAAGMIQFCAPSGPQSLSDSALATVDQEHFVMPVGYRGPVVVMYEQRDGISPTVSLKKLVYAVPPNGIVRSHLPEPPLGTKVTAAFQDKPEAALRTFPSCEEMRLRRSAPDQVATCWIESTQGSDIPPHVAFIVTDWLRIPQLYNQAAQIIDSVVFRKKFHGVPKWEEPKSGQPARQTSTL